MLPCDADWEGREDPTKAEEAKAKAEKDEAKKKKLEAAAEKAAANGTIVNTDVEKTLIGE